MKEHIAWWRDEVTRLRAKFDGRRPPKDFHELRQRRVALPFPVEPAHRIAAIEALVRATGASVKEGHQWQEGAGLPEGASGGRGRAPREALPPR
jgi:hypothetical protein